MSVRAKKDAAGNVTGYQARYLDRRTGKQPSKTFRTKQQALAWEAEQRGRVHRAFAGPLVDIRELAYEVVDGTCSVDAFLEMWAKEAATAGTRGQREHLRKNMGDLQFRSMLAVTTAEIVVWRDGLRGERGVGRKSGLAESTIRTMTRQLRAAFEVAIARGYADTNPVAHLTSKRIRAKAVMPEDVLSVAEIKALVSAWDDPISTMIQVGATTGLRIGEIAGLRAKNVDLRTGKIHVVEQARGGREWVWGPLKSASAQRIIAMPPSTIAMITAYRERVERSKNDPLFQTETGAMWNASNAGRVIRLAGATWTWHDLRHSYASHLFNAGTDVATVSKLLGHSGTSITLETYVHILPGSEESAVEKMAKLYG
ncbi:tyrosine-type recombinase/integrase [Gordonia sp. NPDC003422]